MLKKTLIGIVSIIVLLFIGIVIYQNYLTAPITAHQSKSIWKENELNKSLQNEFPKLNRIINDYGQIFTESQRIELTKVLYNYNIKTTRQIVIVTIDSIKPYNNIQKYATDLGNNLGVGTAEKNNGLIIVVCNPCRQIGIATGTGTEMILTDEICKNVINQTIIPEFKNGEFYNGIKKGVTELIEKWK